MDISTYLGNKIIDHLLRLQAHTLPGAIYVGAHTGDPGLTGANEVSGTGYARQALALNAASAKQGTNSSQIEIPMPSTGGPTFAIPYAGIWDAATAGNFYLRVPLLGENDYFTAADTGDLFTSYAHGLANGDTVMVEQGDGDGLPTGVTAGTVYYIVATATNTFQVSTSAGGAAVTLTGNGEGVVRKLNIKALGLSDVLRLPASGLTVQF